MKDVSIVVSMSLANMFHAIVVMGLEVTRCWNRLYVGEAVSRVSRRNLVVARWLLTDPVCTELLTTEAGQEWTVCNVK